MGRVAPRKVVTVGLEIGSPLADHIDFNSTHSLLDWDVVIFLPDILSMSRSTDTFQGKTALYEAQSFHLKERAEHWRREIKSSLAAGRTVICYLAPLRELFVDSGQRTFSGTGRNQKTTRLLSEYSNYECLPFALKPRSASGKAMKLSAKATALAPYWSQFGDQSEFQVVLEGSAPTAGIHTKANDLNVGGIYVTQAGGNFVALPMIEFYAEDFFEDQDDNGNTDFSAAGKEFGAKLHHAWLAIDTALRSENETTPSPSWADHVDFTLGGEAAAKAALLEAETALVLAQREKEAAEDRVAGAGALRALLYEKGGVLEQAIVSALTILGFTAAPYKDNHSEFDVVFEAPEGRFLGEAEGKDTKAINVDKLRQLAMNIHEDLQRDDVLAPAKPVLFGNGYRLALPSDRAAQFTEKCVLAASSSGTALVPTTELFRVAKYVGEAADSTFASACRRAILGASGIVALPPTPEVGLTAAPDDASL